MGAVLTKVRTSLVMIQTVITKVLLIRLLPRIPEVPMGVMLPACPKAKVASNGSYCGTIVTELVIKGMMKDPSPVKARRLCGTATTKSDHLEQ